MKGRVVIGMSGGVDSSVAAYLLKERGYDVIGVTMKIWDGETEDDGGCCGLSSVFDARRVADMLDIPYYVVNFTGEFREKVVDYFVSEYIAGRTPNPCIACNSFIKWESLLQKALSLGADYIATGHYAKVEKYPATGRYALKLSDAPGKDQTYALYGLNQYQLSKTLMPLGEYSKEETREVAGRIGLKVANKPDSQEICFIPDHNHGRFIQEYTGKNFSEGDFVDAAGNVLGRHKGIANYTIGQRKGLGVAFGKPLFVSSIDVANNTVVLSRESEIFSKALIAESINWSVADIPGGELHVQAKIRYSQKAADCVIRFQDDKVFCTFTEAQRAVTPGQAIVFYDGRYVLGGGIIK